jgi:anti-sigma-K factor RskA
MCMAAGRQDCPARDVVCVIWRRVVSSSALACMRVCMHACLHACERAGQPLVAPLAVEETLRWCWLLPPACDE